MVTRIIMFSLVILISCFGFVNAQINSDLHLIIQNNNADMHLQELLVNNKNLNQVSEIKFVFLGLIKLYQEFISSQQPKQVCIFKNSCSHFGQQAIRKYGFFQGCLMTSDRLQRCNTMSLKYYKVEMQTGKCIDYLDDYNVGKGK